MFEWEQEPSPFRTLEWLVSLGIAFCFLWLFVIGPVRLARHISAHPEIYGWPDPKACNEQREDVSPDGKFLVENDNPCFYSPLGTTVHLYERARMPAWNQDRAESTILNIRSGGPIVTVWKTPTELLVACRRCRREDIWLMRPKYKEVKVVVRFEAYGEPLPDYQRGELEFLHNQGMIK